MKYVQRTERVGELLGPIDWTYDFLSHYGSMCASEDGKREQRDRDLVRLRKMEESCKVGGDVEATTYGGWPRCGWGRVLAVGMYDGWPYWKPVPSVLINGWMGASWHSFDSVTDIRDGAKEPQ